MNENEARVETPEEKVERCDGFIEFGPLERDMIIREAAERKVGEGKPYDEVMKVADAFTPEERDGIYLEALKAKGMDEEKARKVMAGACKDEDDDDPWEVWYAEKIRKDGAE